MSSATTGYEAWAPAARAFASTVIADARRGDCNRADKKMIEYSHQQRVLMTVPASAIHCTCDTNATYAQKKMQSNNIQKTQSKLLYMYVYTSAKL